MLSSLMYFFPAVCYLTVWLQVELARLYIWRASNKRFQVLVIWLRYARLRTAAWMFIEFVLLQYIVSFQND